MSDMELIITKANDFLEDLTQKADSNNINNAWYKEYHEATCFITKYIDIVANITEEEVKEKGFMEVLEYSLALRALCLNLAQLGVRVHRQNK